MGFRVTIFEAPLAPHPSGTALPVDTEFAIVDRYLRALEAAPRHRERDGFDELERAFVGVASSFSTRHGITYAAWRDVDVAHATLDTAGIRDRETSVVSPAYAQHRRVATLAPTHPR